MDELTLYLDRVLWPVTALGPGNRVALWVSGCGRHCRNCANPELWDRKPEQKIEVRRLAKMLDRLVREKHPDGLTVTGGEPFDQAEALVELIDSCSIPFSDILIYTGYQRMELLRFPEKKELLKRTDVLIDGPYQDEQNDPSAVLRGSSNQNIWFLNPELEKTYREYMKLGRQIQNFVYDYQILSVGIHSKAGEKRLSGNPDKEKTEGRIQDECGEK